MNPQLQVEASQLWQMIKLFENQQGCRTEQHHQPRGYNWHIKNTAPTNSRTHISFFPRNNGTFTKINLILGHETNLN